MRKFAEEVIRFLIEKYDDAYVYNLTFNQGVSWKESLELSVKDKYLTIIIPSHQMFHLYEHYKNGDSIWELLLQQLIEM